MAFAQALTRSAVVTLPPARSHWLWRLGRRSGGMLGIKVLHFQALYTEILARVGRLEEPLNTLDRIVVVGEVLRELRHRIPAPGEASLFAQTIAELKRYALGPEDLPLREGLSELIEVFRAYQAYLERHRLQDPDDRRQLALEAVEAGAEVPYELLAVDGFRELGPLEVRFLKAYSRNAQVLLTLPRPLPGVPSTALQARELEGEAYALSHPVEEARWVLNQIKRAVHEEKIDPQEIAIILAPEQAPLLRWMAEMLQVSLRDELMAPWDIPELRRFRDLLLAPEHPTPEVLAAEPALAPLAQQLFRLKTSGLEAVSALIAHNPELSSAWEAFVAELTPRPGAELAWMRSLLEERGPQAEHWRELLIRLGYQAYQLTQGDPRELRNWWAFLLGSLRVPPQGEGVTLTSPQQLAGRRYRLAFVVGATFGALIPPEEEDFFLPDEAGFRVPWEEAFQHRALPMRLRDQSELIYEELRSAGERTYLSYAVVSTQGLQEPDPVLLAPWLVRGALRSSPPLLGAERAPTYGPPELLLREPETLDELDLFRACFYRATLLRLLPEDAEPFSVQLPGRRREVRVELAGRVLRGAIPRFFEETPKALFIAREAESEKEAKQFFAKRLAPSLSLAPLLSDYPKLQVAVYAGKLGREVLIFDAMAKLKQHVEEKKREALHALEEIRSGQTLFSRDLFLCSQCRFAAICRQALRRRR